MSFMHRVPPPEETGCECRYAGWCARHQCEKSPFYHQLCQTRLSLFQLWETGNGPGQTGTTQQRGLPPCQHRSDEPVGEVECDLCGSRIGMLPIYGCELHERCTHRRYSTRTKQAREMASCVGCDDYSASDERPDLLVSKTAHQQE